MSRGPLGRLLPSTGDSACDPRSARTRGPPTPELSSRPCRYHRTSPGQGTCRQRANFGCFQRVSSPEPPRRHRRDAVGTSARGRNMNGVVPTWKSAGKRCRCHVAGCGILLLVLIISTQDGATSRSRIFRHKAVMRTCPSGPQTRTCPSGPHSRGTARIKK